MEQLIGLFFIAVLATFAGAELIGKIPPQLHTPLMTGSNAISGIVIASSSSSAKASKIVAKINKNKKNLKAIFIEKLFLGLKHDWRKRRRFGI